MTIQFAIPGTPCAKARPRMAVIAGHARAYTAEKTARYESIVAAIGSQYRPPSPLEGPLMVWVDAIFPRPKYMLERRKDRTLKFAGGEGRIPHTAKIDADNIAKASLDGLNHSGIWIDDAQIVSLSIRKWYAAIGESAEVRVMIADLDERFFFPWGLAAEVV